jgi:hypothetical protein
LTTLRSANKKLRSIQKEWGFQAASVGPAAITIFQHTRSSHAVLPRCFAPAGMNVDILSRAKARAPQRNEFFSSL